MKHGLTGPVIKQVNIYPFHIIAESTLHSLVTQIIHFSNIETREKASLAG